MEFNIDKTEQWQEVVDKILPLRYPILLLKGDLGAGKTTFTKYLLQSLGCIDEISSPTYSIVNEYEYSQGKIYHFDLYRMKSIEEVLDIGMDEYLYSGNLCIIEWPEVYEIELQNLLVHQILIQNTEGIRTVIFS